MAWAKFDDVFPEHPKIVGLSDAAFRLQVEAVCYSNRHLTDGLVLAVVLPRISGVKHPVKVAGELVAAGLWETTAEGWWIHDYLVYQPSRAKVLEEREQAAERQRRRRARHGVTAPPVTPEVTDMSQRDSHRTSGVVTRPRPDPSRPDPSTSSSSSTETPAALHVVGDDDEWIDRVVALAATRRLERAITDGHPPRVPSAWLRSVRQQIRTDDAETLADLRRRRPDLDPDDAVLALEGLTPSRPPCTACDDIGVLERSDGTCVDCPTCKAAS